jgi:hypothetical protein
MIKIITNIIIFLSITTNQGFVRNINCKLPIYFQNTEKSFIFAYNKNNQIYNYIEIGKMEKLEINCRLTTLNEYINIERGNRFAAAKLKQTNHEKIFIQIMLNKFKPLAENLYYVIIEWFNYKADSDNVEFAQKGIFDCLQNTKFLKNDNKKNILHKIHFHLKDKSKQEKCNVLFFSDKNEFIDYFNNKILEND